MPCSEKLNGYLTVSALNFSAILSRSFAMELYHLRTFVIVAEEKNVTRAAKRLFMTPPAVSAHIKTLEEELNVTLFVRTPQGMQITEKGLLLKTKAEQTLRAAQDMVNHATQMQNHLLGRVAVGLNALPGFLRVGQLVTQISTNYPGIDLAFVSSVSGRIIEGLQNGTLDTGYIFGASPCEPVVSRCLATVELVIAAPKSWESQTANADWKDIADLPWIYSTIYCPFQVIIDDLFKQHSLKCRHAVQSEDELTKCELVSAGVGLALLEKQEAEDAAEAGKLTIWKTDPIQCELSLAYLGERRQDPLVAALETEVLRIWNVVRT
jgi:DNA-binding transcriptional LysR family regulator